MNKWIVLSPGRAASTLVLHMIRKQPASDPMTVLHQHITGKEPEFKMPQDNFVWHSHYLSTLDFLDDSIKLVIITREISDITLSYEIARMSNVFNLFQRSKDVGNKINQKVIEKIKPFHFPVWKFLYEYEKLYQWHVDCRNIIKERNIKPVAIIDYKDIVDNNDKIYNILQLENLGSQNDLTIKLPYEYNKIITNIQDLYNKINPEKDSGYKLLTS